MEIRRIIEESYNDYLLADSDTSKEIHARHIARTASGFIKNQGSKLEDWLEVFSREEIVIEKLKQIKKNE
jgi:hypothetical protein